MRHFLILPALVACGLWMSGQVCALGVVLKHSRIGLDIANLLAMSSTITPITTITPTSELLVTNQHYIRML